MNNFDDNCRKISPEIFYPNSPITVIGEDFVNGLVTQAINNSRQRSRLCAHPNTDDPLHEMLIVHHNSAYIRPHKHPGKSESTHIIMGKADFIIFDDNGFIDQVIPMGQFGFGGKFFIRLDRPSFHTLLIRSEFLVFHETTNGPFDRKDTVFAPWSPKDTETTEIEAYINNLNNEILELDN